MPKTRTYRPRPTRIIIRIRRDHKRSITALALVNGVSFNAQLIAMALEQARLG